MGVPLAPLSLSEMSLDVQLLPFARDHPRTHPSCELEAEIQADEAIE